MEKEVHGKIEKEVHENIEKIDQEKYNALGTNETSKRMPGWSPAVRQASSIFQATKSYVKELEERAQNCILLAKQNGRTRSQTGT